MCASAFWALLPVIARDQLGLGAGGFGLLSASFGIGAIVGAISIPGQLHRQSMNRVVTSGGVLWALAMFVVALTVDTWLALLGAGCAGAAWVYVFASLSAGTQSSAPAWVRARAVSMNLVATQGCLALGSAVWGGVASASARVGRLACPRQRYASAMALPAGARRDGSGGRRCPRGALARARRRGGAASRRRSSADPARIPDRAGEPGRVPAGDSESRARHDGATARRAGGSFAISARKAASSSATSSPPGPSMFACARA